MDALRLFEHCPRCGTPQPPPAEARPDGPFRCRACALILYFNPAGAVAAILVRADGRVLFIRRSHEPAKGRLGMPGGFVDPGESVEEALRREVREESGLEVEGLQYLSSHANRYDYAGVTYHTVDMFFIAETHDPERAEALDQVEDVLWLDPFTVPLEDLAFDSMRAALVGYRERHRRLAQAPASTGPPAA